MPDIGVSDARLRYEQWRRRVHGPAHARRTAERNAEFFLPHLRPGMRLLDAGSGPGSITVGLAEVVVDGEAIGIDASEDAIEAARATVASLGRSNLRFEVADICALPFEDASFDAVFCHAVLQHLRDPLAGLRELRRVMRRGGVIGVADADLDGSIIAPADPALDASGQFLQELSERSTGGDRRIGRRLRQLLNDAGFERVTASVSAHSEGDTEAVRRTGLFWAAFYRAPELREYAVELGFATDEELEAMGDAWIRWSESPGAFWASFWCQAIGWVG